MRTAKLFLINILPTEPKVEPLSSDCDVSDKELFKIVEVLVNRSISSPSLRSDKKNNNAGTENA